MLNGRQRFGVAVTLLFVVFSAIIVIQGQTGKTITGKATGAQAGGCNDLGPLPELPESATVNDNGIQGGLERVARPLVVDVEQIGDEYIVKLWPSQDLKVTVDTPDMKAVDPTVVAALKSIDAGDIDGVYTLPAVSGVGQKRLGTDRVYRFNSNQGPMNVLASLHDLEGVEWIEPLMAVGLHANPNDKYWGYQWNMSSVGLPIVWNKYKGEGSIVAVLDTGVSSGKDGYVNLLRGYDFVDKDDLADDDDGHGSHVAATIAQASFNKKGTAGVAPEASILPVRVLGPKGGSTDNIAAGIIWATDNGADVINMSLGLKTKSKLMADAIEYAHNNGVVLVASSGNDGFTDFLCYPASDDLVIAVGASDMRGDITNYSNYGVGIDLTAPGGDTSADLDGDGYGDGILQETMKKGTWGYFFYQGTSMASPHVAGAAALLISKGLVEPEEIRQALELSADDMGDVGPDEEYGYGLLNVDAAIKFEAPEEEAPDISDVQIVRNGGHRVTITWRTSEPGTTKGMSNEQWKYTDNDMVTSHQITLKPSQFRGVNFSDGEMQRLKIVSHTADGREMRDDIDFGGFDDPQDDLFAATRGSADSCDGIASECQGRLALAIEVSDTFVAACQDWIADCRCAGTVQEHVQIRCDERSDIRLDRAELAYDECMIVAEECRGNGLAQEL